MLDSSEIRCNINKLDELTHSFHFQESNPNKDIMEEVKYGLVFNKKIDDNEFIIRSNLHDLSYLIDVLKSSEIGIKDFINKVDGHYNG